MKTNCLINQSFLTLKASVPTAVSLITVLIFQLILKHHVGR